MKILLYISNFIVKIFKLEQIGIIIYKCLIIMMKYFVKVKILLFKYNMIIINENKILIV